MANPVIILNSIQDLLTTPGQVGDIVAVNDLQTTAGNLFSWQQVATANQIFNPVNPTEVMGGTIYKNPNGFWVMMYDGPINVRWFGAKGDGVQDDTMSFQAAVDTLAASIYVPSSEYGRGYVINKTGIIIRNNGITPNPSFALTIFGDNKVRSKIWSVVPESTIFTVRSQFVKIESLDFENRGTKDSKGILIEAGTCTISDCYFGDFPGLDRSFIGIYNSVIFTNDDHNIKGCHFQECSIGIESDGEFKNSRINEFCEFYNCDTAIKLYSQPGPDKDTEGVTIHNCAFYFCGNGDKKMPAINIDKCPYTYIIDCMVDQCHFNALQMTNSSFSKLMGCWFACPKAPDDTSVVLLNGLNSDLFINNCNFNDCKRYGIEIVGDKIPNPRPEPPYPALHIVISNSSFYPYVDLTPDADVCKQHAVGQIYIHNANDVLIQACNLYYINDFQTKCSAPPDTWNAIVASKDDYNLSSVLIDACYINGNIFKGNPKIDVRLTNCRNKFTVKAGIGVIEANSNVFTVDHGLTVLPGQAISVTATNGTNFDLITAGIFNNQIRFIRQFISNQAISISYYAAVFNDF